MDVLGRIVGVRLLKFLRMLLSCKKRSSSEQYCSTPAWCCRATYEYRDTITSY